MASIRKIRTKWEARVRVKGFPTFCKSFTNKVDAIRWARGVEVELEKGLTPKDKYQQQMTFGQAVTKYLEEISPTKKSFDSEKYRLKLLLDSSLTNKALKDITPKDLRQFRDKRLQKVRGPSVRKEVYLISAIFTAAIKEWGLESLRNPVPLITIPKDSQPRVQRLLPSERNRLLNCLETQSNYHLQLVVKLALETAMRRSEILKIRVADIDFQNCLVVIRETKNSTMRTIPLTTKALDLLGKQKGENEYLLNCSGNSIRLAWSRFQKKFGFEYLRFHDLRHEAISHFFELGLTVPEVSAISGHRTKAQLFRYAHSDILQISAKLKS